MESLKLISAIFTPIVLLILGIWAKSLATRHEKNLSLHSKIIEKRIELYEQIGKDLNDIFVFLMQVGHWKNLPPQDIIEKKRHLDQIMYSNRPYWDANCFSHFSAFMKIGFESWTGIGEDAKIRTNTHKFEVLDSWQDTWKQYYSDKPSSPTEIKQSYQQLMNALSDSFGFEH